jgi:hypothetical protein
VTPHRSELVVKRNGEIDGENVRHSCFAKGRQSNIELKCWLHIVVHEGFSVLHIMDRYRKALAEQTLNPVGIGFHFDVSEYADRRMLGAIATTFSESPTSRCCC